MQTLSDRQDRMDSRMDAMLSASASLPTTTTPLSPSTPLSPADVNDAALRAALLVERNRTVLQSKATRIVFVGKPEKNTPAETAKSDEEFIATLVKELAIPALSDAMAAGRLQHHRHPAHAHPRSDGRPLARPLKFDLCDPSLRDLVLDRIRSRDRPSVMSTVRYARRDLSLEELDLERKAKQEARKLNEQLGQIVWGVQDIKLRRFSKPRPFPADY